MSTLLLCAGVFTAQVGGVCCWTALKDGQSTTARVGWILAGSLIAAIGYTAVNLIANV